MRPMATNLTFQDLRSNDEGTFNTAWALFFLSEDLVGRFLRESSIEQVHATLSAGYRWSGAGWNTTKAATRLKKLCGVTMVSGRIQEYSH